MKNWWYHLLCLLIGMIALTICVVLMPMLLLFFVIFGIYAKISALCLAYICGRIVLDIDDFRSYHRV